MAKLTVNRLNSTWTPLNNQEANYKVCQPIGRFLFDCKALCCVNAPIPVL